MQLLTWFLIGLSLSLDAFAVSVANGLSVRRLRWTYALRIALFFGGFQALMPLLGWLAGRSIAVYVQGFDHWIAFGLLAVLGVKMIWESFKMKDAEKECDPLKNYALLILAVATSLDALAVGFTFALLGSTIAAPVVIIGLTTFVLCFAGVFIGDRIGHLFENKLEAIAGVILILIGIKILVQHLIGKV
jgi:putative Mn2+ efflux pump MntP